MYRTHIIIVLSLCVIFIFEPEWPLWAPFVIIGVVVVMSVCSKVTAVYIKPRCSTPKQKALFDRMSMAESHWTPKQTGFGIEKAPYKVSAEFTLTKPLKQKRWSFTRQQQQNDHKVPLLSAEMYTIN